MAKASADKTTRSGLSRQLVTSELLDKATELFAEKGYESTSLLDIAQALGISRPALYHYVSSKEELLSILVEQVSLGLGEVLDNLSARDDLLPTQKLVDVVGLMVRQRAEHPAQFRILDRSETVLPEPVGTQHRDAKRRVLRGVTAVIEAGIDAGEFRPVDPRTTALSLLGMCNWVAWWFARGSDVEAVVATVIDLATAMLVADTSAPRPHTADTVDEIRVLLDRIAPAR
ncbi:MULTISPECIES: TetR/AcrR family transcriptional regulator [unclassified Nocardioides]|uniref:TetR/AcrR family transcriptional regulator n=1 Tax=unclassified Nocardioides TaxID=2615069 RepID=UPI0006FBEA5E|nr:MULTISPECIES: TetR/AcrR family transcriptional regulator [unclassified Nocardioides]KQY55494.1 TetR family transcriptional regulator [Nocardioides sp. Root140]KRF12770.1 TetR family transcriptional regulator [Nocardioides sp. Soil796]